ncbi:insecticidal toxin protein [Geodermatophilus amargosae]|nr:insecticidal toxin protein [Geodermatophilus amargosae]
MTSIAAWQQNPFKPHLVAGHRPSAYMVHTVMAYLDNLIAWGDALFGQDSPETVAEAGQLYVLAANLLGPRPQQVPRRSSVLPQTYRSLRARLRTLDAQENALSYGDLTQTPSVEGPDGARQLDTLGLTSFCTPPNEKLLGYWDIVADRLFKLRNSLNLAGAFRRLPTFDPPIDPAMLARAATAGVDVAAVVSGVNQPAPLVRFGLLAAKAAELCQEVKSLGAALLSAIEKQDGEALAAMRAEHEVATLHLGETVKYAQWQEAIKSREALEMSQEIVRARYTYYQRLLGAADPPEFADAQALDAEGLERGDFASTEPTTSLVEVDVDIDDSPIPALLAEGRKIGKHESRELALLELSQLAQDTAAGADVLAGTLNAVPLFSIDVKPIGTGAGTTFGGPNLAAIVAASAAAYRGYAGRFDHEAGRAARVGGYARREQEWQFQSNAAAGELNQIAKQLRAAEIREFMAERELKNHAQQVVQAEDVERFLAGERPGGKTTTTAYYALMRREVRELYNRCYQLALETAQKAERALRNELGDPDLTFVAPRYLAGTEGLLAGEKLHLDVRRMELAYLDLNRREYELLKSVSLLQLAPLELVRLRATGRATFTIPEELFDLDTPGHYFRRIRSVSVSIPSITGPYTGVACTARLLRSHVRTSPALTNDRYAEATDGDDRFDHQLGATEAIVTSVGSNDSGLFETNLRDERLLPFEYRGAAGEWQLELASDPRPFDYNTITDVVLHVRYTAREGGEALRLAAAANLRGRVAAGAAAGSTRLLSVRHEFPSEWARFAAAPAGPGTAEDPRAALTFELRREHYPFLAGSGPSSLRAVDLVAQPADDGVDAVTIADRAVTTVGGETASAVLTKRADLGNLRYGTLAPVSSGSGWGPLPAPVGRLELFVDTALTDLLILLTWS